jgi:hypothetical protein
LPNGIAEWRLPSGDCRRSIGDWRWAGRWVTAAIVVVAAMLSGCGDAVRGGTGSSYLVMTSLTSSQGTTLHSDVRNDTTGGIIDDVGTAEFQLNMKDVLSQPSANNAITLTQYHVEYARSDGHNVPGVDVPYAFDGAINVTIASTGSVGFTLVRIQAKVEAPLKALALGGGQVAITTFARVTFYGHDQTGRGVAVSGNIEVTFADWVG